MKFAILLHTTDYRGDHSADVAVAIQPQAGETIEQLIERAPLVAPMDRMEIRVLVEAPPCDLKA